MPRKNKERFDQRHYSHINLAPYFFVFPVVITLLLLIVYPLAEGMYFSLFKTNLVDRWEFVGIQNYISAFVDSGFLKTIGTTLGFAAVVVAGHFLIGMVGAVALNSPLNRHSTLFRAILVIPWFFSDVVVALIFKWILNPTYGILNNYLLDIGAIERGISWLGSTKYAFWVVCFVCIWKAYPLVLVNVLAALQSVPNDIKEAAEVDGASKIKVFFSIVLPSIKPVIATTAILDVVWWFKHYTTVQVLTAGGPNNTTNVVSIEIYKQAFTYYDFGQASAMAVIVFAVCFLISKGFRRVLSND